MCFNQNTPVNIKLNKSNNTINNVNNFKYMGAWIISSEKDFEISKAISWISNS